MKKSYWVVAYRSISHESAVQAYGALAVPAVQSSGGRFFDQVHEPDSGPRSSIAAADYHCRVRQL
jgi:uncharacterized protein (DUF1330 family)